LNDEMSVNLGLIEHANKQKKGHEFGVAGGGNNGFNPRAQMTPATPHLGG